MSFRDIRIILAEDIGRERKQEGVRRGYAGSDLAKQDLRSFEDLVSALFVLLHVIGEPLGQ